LRHPGLHPAPGSPNPSHAARRAAPRPSRVPRRPSPDPADPPPGTWTPAVGLRVGSAAGRLRRGHWALGGPTVGRPLALAAELGQVVGIGAGPPPPHPPGVPPGRTLGWSDPTEDGTLPVSLWPRSA